MFKCLGYGHRALNCPNQRVMVLKNGEVKTDSSSSSSPSSPTMSTSSSLIDNELPPQKGDILVWRQKIGHVHKDIGETQRENIFHSRCLINNKVCVLIIDGGSCTNVVSKRLVDMLNLKTIPHPNPYKLQWLSEDGELKLLTKYL